MSKRKPPPRIIDVALGHPLIEEGMEIHFQCDINELAKTTVDVIREAHRVGVEDEEGPQVGFQHKEIKDANPALEYHCRCGLAPNCECSSCHATAREGQAQG